MKKLILKRSFARLFCMATLFASLTSAVSAEEPSFSGSNLGVTASFARAFDDQVEDPSDPPYTYGAEIDINSFAGGVFVGHDWQISQFVMGLIAEAALSGGQGDTFQWHPSPGNIDTEFPVSAEILARLGLRARAGAIWANNLFYATGGLALAHVERGYYDPDNGQESVHNTWDLGLVAGAGIERKVLDTVSIRLEYLHTWYEDQVVDPSVLDNFCCDQGVELSSDAVNLSVVFHLGEH